MYRINIVDIVYMVIHIGKLLVFASSIQFENMFKIKYQTKRINWIMAMLNIHCLINILEV